MMRCGFDGTVRAIESNLDTDVLTLEYWLFGGVSTETMDIIVKHEKGNESLFRRPVRIVVAIEEEEEQ